MNLWLSFNKATSLWPDKEGLVDGNKRYSYRQFGERVAALTRQLASLGLSRGSTAAISCPNASEYMEVYYACAISGIVLVPLNYRLAGEELVDIIADSDAELSVLSHRFMETSPRVVASMPEPAPCCAYWR